MGPKFFARLVRFQRFVRALAGRLRPWPRGAGVTAGYCDQAHLIREFRALAGETPGRFASERHELSDFLTGRRRSPAAEPARDE